MSMTAEKLRQLALQSGATMKIGGKTFNADGLKLPAKKKVLPTPAPAPEPVKPDNTIEIVSQMLAKSIKELAEKQGIDYMALVAAISRLQPAPRPIYSGIVPVRNSDGTIKRYDLITEG